MTLFCSNYCGIGNDATVRELHDFTRKFAPSIMCIVETGVHKTRVENYATSFGYDKFCSQ
jgi:hypothetical protein